MSAITTADGSGGGTTIAPAGCTFAEMSVFFRGERAHMEAKLAEQHAATLAERRALKAEVAEMRAERTEKECISASDLVAVATRLEKLHAAGLLEDREFFGFEDALSDFSDLRRSMHPQLISSHMLNVLGSDLPAVKCVARIVGGSGIFQSDAAFARQLKRKVNLV